MLVMFYIHETCIRPKKEDRDQSGVMLEKGENNQKRRMEKEGEEQRDQNTRWRRRRGKEVGGKKGDIYTRLPS